MLTEEMKHDIETAIKIAGRRKAACIDALTIIQRHEGWVSDNSVREIADFLEMTPAEVDSVATFYNHIFRKPVGKHVIMVCDSVTCWMLGYDEIRKYLTQRLGIEPGQTTADNRFTLVSIQCLGTCDHAPAMMIDQDTYRDLTTEKIDSILQAYE
jgi:NADH-quinone oxidoreductase subunit E